jgi:hypothetical protein
MARNTAAAGKGSTANALFWPGSAETYQGEAGELIQGIDDNGFLCHSVAGCLTQDMADRIIAAGPKIAKQPGRLVVFSDWHLCTRDESSCRTTMTNWAIELDTRLHGYHIIGGSRLVQMGITVAALVVKPLVAYRSREEFLAGYATYAKRQGKAAQT